MIRLCCTSAKADAFYLLISVLMHLQEGGDKSVFPESESNLSYLTCLVNFYPISLPTHTSLTKWLLLTNT